MSWHPNDLVIDADLVAYERKILTQFGATDWQARRQKAIEDWLFPLLEQRGFNPHLFRTRFEASAVFGYTSSVFSDKTAAAKADDGLNLATILAASSDYLYIGSAQPFRGLSVRMLDAVSGVATTLAIGVWTDRWTAPVGLSNGTIAVATKPFSGGGAITWTLPPDLVRRPVNSSDPIYWARLSLAATPTVGTSIGALSVIRRSRLCAAVTFKTLALIFREAPTSQEGPWTEKALYYEQAAADAWLRVADQIGGEFDTDNSDVISPDEAAQTADDVSQGGWTLERA